MNETEAKELMDKVQKGGTMIEDDTTIEIKNSATGRTTGPIPGKEFDRRAKLLLQKGEMRQERLIRLTAGEVIGLKSDMCNKVAEYIHIDEEKSAADADFNERLKKLWDEIKGIQTRINEG